MATVTYHPSREKIPKSKDLPLELSLVYQVRACGTCDFFWPKDPSKQPYGPFPSFDFSVNFPEKKPPEEAPESYPWMQITTQKPCFPNGEIMDGCRKAPIMTIGINPNLTAFSPGKTGTSWAYPNFSSEGSTNEWAKYAFYYRYRNVYQERFDFDKVKNYIEETGQIIAKQDGSIISANRPDGSPSLNLVIQYKGEAQPETIKLSRNLGEARYVLLFNRENPGNEFKEGDVLAGKLNIPEGQTLELYQEKQTYYEQFVPALKGFEEFLTQQGHQNVNLHMGEDVCQLDMVACASPHWNPDFLGGTKASEAQVISNCVHKNAWAIKQFVQTKPAVLFLVGESSWSMFKKSFGNLVQRDPPLSAHPYDGAFTLFSETIDHKHPALFKFSSNTFGIDYNLETRIIVTPHFSYDTNFLPQFRLSKKWLSELESKYSQCIEFLKQDKRIRFSAAEKWGYDAFLILKDKDQVLQELSEKFPDASKELKLDFYDPHTQMTEVLNDLYLSKKLQFSDSHGYLERSKGACQFCVNDLWSFPAGCPYENIKEKQPPIGTLDQIASEIVKQGS